MSSTVTAFVSSSKAAMVAIVSAMTVATEHAASVGFASMVPSKHTTMPVAAVAVAATKQPAVPFSMTPVAKGIFCPLVSLVTVSAEKLSPAAVRVMSYTVMFPVSFK